MQQRGELGGHLLLGARQPAVNRDERQADGAAQEEADESWEMALKTDEYISHRLRNFADPTGHVDDYLKSQKGGASTAYVKPDAG